MRDGQRFHGGGCGCEPGEHAFGTAGAPTSRRGFLRAAAAAAAAAPAMLAAACSGGGGGGRAAQSGAATLPESQAPGAGGQTPSGTAGASTRGTSAGGGPETADAGLLAARYQGLKPFAAAPAAPAVKPVDTDVALPPVVDHIPGLTDKICFLTIDDGMEKDLVFLQMVQDFKVPITLFLTDQMIKDDYGYFTKLKDTGYCTIQNHTLTHPNLVQLSAAKQYAEISGQQAKLVREYGSTPYLFRAPFGNSNMATRQACKKTGLKAVMHWKASFQKQGFQWQAADKKLQPGDVLLAHFRGPKALGAEWPEMHQLMINLFRIVQEQGFTFARLEDYI